MKFEPNFQMVGLTGNSLLITPAVGQARENLALEVGRNSRLLQGGHEPIVVLSKCGAFVVVFVVASCQPGNSQKKAHL